ncbi:MAG: NlpC/P60 family protein [Alphaproteobacteria bacterium]|nr:NlpC/P60 family protein [Alphaproteobacteria bacterium]
MTLDPRTNAFRADLADMALRDSVKARKYVEPVMRQCLRGVLPLLNAPKADATQTSQIRYGEFMDVFEEREDGFLWVQNRSDRYVGYITDTGELGDSIAMMSNRITALRTFVYPKPNVKTPPIDELTLGSFVGLNGKHGRLLELTSGGFVFESHVMATEFAHTADYVFTSGRLLHTPYLWGGRTPKGIDCSGMVQLVLEMAGIDFPRDVDQQREAFGKPLDIHWRDKNWRRGDIVFFLPDPHVGIMTGTDHIIHASAYTMDVTVEPLADLVGRGNEIVAVAEGKDLAG